MLHKERRAQILQARASPTQRVRRGSWWVSARSPQGNKDNSVLITAEIGLGIGQQEAADPFGGF